MCVALSYMTDVLLHGEFDAAGVEKMLSPARRLPRDWTTVYDSEFYRPVVAEPTDELSDLMVGLAVADRRMDPERLGHYSYNTYPGRIFVARSEFMPSSLRVADSMIQRTEAVALSAIGVLAKIGLVALGPEWRTSKYGLDISPKRSADYVPDWHNDNRRNRDFVHMLFSPLGTRLLDLSKPPTPQTRKLTSDEVEEAKIDPSHFDGKIVMINGQTYHGRPTIEEFAAFFEETGTDRRPFVGVIFRKMKIS